MNIINRFKNQRISQVIHLKNRPKGSKQARVENCLRLKTGRAPSVALKKRSGAEKASYSGLQQCGSVWSCPIDSSIISERRKNTLQKGIDNFRQKKEGNSVTMITITSPHYIFQSLKNVIGIQDKAIKIMKNQPQRGSYKVYKTIMEEMVSTGSFTGREITFGQNGWHPHRHEIVFCVTASIDQLIKWRNELSLAWSIAFQKAGGVINNKSVFLNRAIRFDQITNDDGFKRIASYVTSVEGSSWSLAQEATKSIVKTAKNGNITPFGMLEAIRQGNKHSLLYSAKFYEYATTMYGKKQFFPSAGLNHLLNINWKTDQEIIKDSQGGHHFANITDSEWLQINDLNIRGEIIELSAGRNDFEFINDLVLLLKEYQLEKTG